MSLVPGFLHFVYLELYHVNVVCMHIYPHIHMHILTSVADLASEFGYHMYACCMCIYVYMLCILCCTSCMTALWIGTCVHSFFTCGISHVDVVYTYIYPHTYTYHLHVHLFLFASRCLGSGSEQYVGESERGRREVGRGIREKEWSGRRYDDSERTGKREQRE